jgi:serine/threonine protein kinase
MSLGQGNLLNQRYRIVEILGRGGMGAVYRAVDESLGVDVAVKENLFTSDDYARQFRMEAMILAGMRHPNLPRVTDHFVLDGQGQYLVMDYIEGDDLRQRIEKTGTLNEAEAIRIGAAVCDALTFLHSRKPPILHRDIKLGNIKLTSDGNVILVDFGLAKMAWEHEETMTGARAMTPGYSPPEQYGTARTDARSDIYSLGATLYAAISGVVPEDSLMRAVDGVELTPLRKHNSTISERLAGVIEKAMAPSPGNRYQTAEEFKQALLNSEKSDDNPQQDNDSTPTAAQRTRPKPRQAGGLLRLFLLVLLMTLTVLAVILFSPANRQFVASFLALATHPTATLTQTATPTSAASSTPTPTAVVLPSSSPTSTRTRTPASTKTPLPTATLVTPSVVAATQPAASPAAASPASGEIAFASIVNKAAQIFLINADGSNLRQLTQAPNGACSFSWKPDGRELIYASPCRAKSLLYPDSGLYLLDLETGLTRPLLKEVQGEFDPAWSPDGTHIAFTSLRDGTWQIYIYDLTTSETTRLTEAQNDVNSRFPAWSPDGKQIVYTARVRGMLQIWSMNPDGTEKQRLVQNNNSVSDYLPAWSPDGAFLLFSENNFELSAPAWLMRLEQGQKQAVRLEAAIPPVVDVSFAPQGIWLAYETVVDSHQAIYLFNTQTGERKPLTGGSPVEDFDPLWRPILQP